MESAGRSRRDTPLEAPWSAFPRPCSPFRLGTRARRALGVRLRRTASRGRGEHRACAREGVARRLRGKECEASVTRLRRRRLRGGGSPRAGSSGRGATARYVQVL
ncbi:unnamed protein product [Lepidochelys olivacea]